jgi:Methyltransferase domain
VLEIGVYSGGSLGMWRSYFGPQSHIIGLDIEESCKAYESDHVQIEIGDQSDRNFWQNFKKKIGPVDVIIDDGGHLPKQQKVTLEELLPHLNPGGVYLCEDITGEHNPFHSYIDGVSRALHALNWNQENVDANAFQSRVEAIHTYPFVCVIQTRDSDMALLQADKRGTQWQPFFERS